MDGLDKAKYEADCKEAGNDEAKLKTLKVSSTYIFRSLAHTTTDPLIDSK